MDGFETAVFTRQPVDRSAARGGGRWRRRQSALPYGWHLIQADRPLTWCGLQVSYTYPRRLWSEIPEDRQCQSCIARYERGGHVGTSQRVP